MQSSRPASSHKNAPGSMRKMKCVRPLVYVVACTRTNQIRKEALVVCRGGFVDFIILVCVNAASVKSDRTIHQYQHEHRDNIVENQEARNMAF